MREWLAPSRCLVSGRWWVLLLFVLGLWPPENLFLPTFFLLDPLVSTILDYQNLPLEMKGQPIWTPTHSRCSVFSPGSFPCGTWNGDPPPPPVLARDAQWSQLA